MLDKVHDETLDKIHDETLDKIHDDPFVTSRWPRAPFPGLRPFSVGKDVDESLIFYGRNSDKDEILTRLNSNHLVFVIGPSGCGKSSLVKAGVIPALEAGLLKQAGHKWRSTEMRPGQRPLRQLAIALARLRSDPEDKLLVKEIYRVLRSDKNGLWMVVESLYPCNSDASPLLLLLDQFEEVFGPQITSQNEVRLFLDRVVRFFQKPHPKLYCIVTMRTDFLGLCANFPSLADAINSTLFITPVLREQELEKVIPLPPEDYHGEVEPELIKTIISDMRADVGYNPDHLPLMQHAALWLWNQALAQSGVASPRPDQEPPERPPLLLTTESYTKAGRLKGILNLHAEKLFESLSAREKEIAEVLFRRLSERDAENRYRRAPAAASAVRQLAGCEKSELDKVVAVFAHPDASFVLPRPSSSRDDDDDELLDVSHESLIRQWNRLRKWADDEAEKVRNLRDLARSAALWRHGDRSENYLKRGGEFQYWENWWTAKKPTAEWVKRYRQTRVNGNSLPELFDVTDEYMQASRDKVAELERDAAKRKIAIVSAAAAAVLAVWIGSAALLQYRNNLLEQKNKETVERLEQARARVLAARVDETLDRDGATRAVLIGLAGLDGATAYVPELERNTYAALQELRERQIVPGGSAFAAASFSPTAHVLLTTKQGELHFWSTLTHKLMATAAIHGFGSLRPKWSDNGDWIIAGNGDGRTVLFAPCSQGILRTLFRTCEGKTTDVARLIGTAGTASWPAVLSPNGKFLLSGGFGTSPTLWDISGEAPKPHRFTDLVAGFAIAFRPDGAVFAFGSNDGSVRVRETANPDKELHVLQPRRAETTGSQQPPPASEDTPRAGSPPVAFVAFHPKDPNALIAASQDGIVRVWNFTTGRILHTYNTGSPGFISAAVNSDGTHIAVTSDAGTVRVWAPATDEKREQKSELRGHRLSTWMVDFSRKDGLLVSASSDSTRVWKVEPAAFKYSKADGKDIHLPANSFEAKNGILTFRNVVDGKDITFKPATIAYSPAAAAISPDGTHVFVALRSGELHLYRTGFPEKPIAEFDVDEFEWQKVAFMPDRIVALSSSGAAYSWPHFKDLKAFTDFARQHLPVDDGRPVELSHEEKCILGIAGESSCPTP
jgi:WD40 repeat protein/energy-coupling factor transporter ATP-binding protein EcfA2